MARPKKILTFGSLGGCGDVAVWSTLPERFTEQGFDVYLDADNLTRNSDIMDFWYACNPFIVGTSTEKPNCGYTLQGSTYTIANRLPLGSGISAVERAHGLPPPYSLNPKTYYKPKPYSLDLSDTVLVDLSARSTVITEQGIQEHLITHINERYAGKNFLMVTFPGGVLTTTPLLNGPSIRMNSIFDYADAIAACHAIVCSEAGSQAIAAAIRGGTCFDFELRPDVVSIISNRTYNSNLYAFRAVDYRVCSKTSNAGEDYWSPVELPYNNYQIIARRSVEEARAQWDAAIASREAASLESIAKDAAATAREWDGYTDSQDDHRDWITKEGMA